MMLNPINIALFAVFKKTAGVVELSMSFGNVDNCLDIGAYSCVHNSQSEAGDCH